MRAGPRKEGAGFAEPTPLKASYARVGCIGPAEYRDRWLNTWEHHDESRVAKNRMRTEKMLGVQCPEDATRPVFNKECLQG